VRWGGGGNAAQPGVLRQTRNLPPRNVHVVIIDDSCACRGVIRELLERRGYEVTGEAGCAAAAIELVERLSPDAVLLDVRLPDGNGFELAARLRERHPGLAILLTSIDFEGGFYALADVSGARGFVPKSQLAQVQFDLFWSNCVQV
jgi:DNA-binding NarL/FixJ family response regulator